MARKSARTRWAVAGFVLCVVSLGIELGTHLCASVFFDPLPDLSTAAAYVFLVAMLLFNEHALRRGRQTSDWRSEKRLLAGALAGTAFCFPLAVLATFMFLPLLPFGLLVFWLGIGLCVWSPVFALCVLGAQWRALRDRWRAREPQTLHFVVARSRLSAAASLIAFLVWPVIVGYHLRGALESGPRREISLAWLRTLRAESALLYLCHDKPLPFWVAWGRSPSWFPAFEHNGRTGRDQEQARITYYLLTGRTYETAPPPTGALGDGLREDWRRDVAAEETGGEVVGHAVEGLNLVRSRIEGTLDPAAETASCAWTLVFRNTTSAPQEARADIVLPPGGVVDKVSLWINGEERPAAFGARETVRAAYQSVAVVQRRDPLLVTAVGADRVMAQCFPVPPRGVMQIRLGITAPLVWKNAAAPRLHFTPPALGRVNFGLPAGLRHQVRLEAQGSTAQDRWAGAGWSVVGQGMRTVHARFAPTQIFRPPCLALANGRVPRVGDRLSPQLVRRVSPFEQASGPVDLVVVVDNVAALGSFFGVERREALWEALATLPAGSRVRFAGTRRPDREVSPWWDAHRLADVHASWRSQRFVGGVDPVPALVWAWDQAARSPNPSAVLWLHGATPPGIGDAAPLARRLAEDPAGPPLVGVAFQPGPDALLDQLADQERVWALAAPPSADTIAEAVHLAAAVAVRAPASATNATATPLGGRVPALNGVYATPDHGAATSAGRLATYSRVLAAWYTRNEAARNNAARLAARRRLVTPLSGAVVLETQEQYRQHGLSDKEESVAVPEPSTLVLLGVGMIGMAWAGWRRRAPEPRGVRR